MEKNEFEICKDSRMKWSKFNNICKKYFAPSSTLYHRIVILKTSNIAAFFAYKTGISPNMISVLSSLMALLGMAVVIWKPNSLVIGLCNLALLQLCFILDYADGMLARFQNKASRFGAFLDDTLDTFNHYVVFIGFGIAWVIKSPEEICLKNVVLYIIGASLYTFYYEISMIRGHKFNNLKGTMQKFGQNWKERTLKIPYELLNRGVHYLLLSVAYIFGGIYWMVLFYGILGGSLSVAMIAYVYFKDAKKGKTAV